MARLGRPEGNRTAGGICWLRPAHVEEAVNRHPNPRNSDLWVHTMRFKERGYLGEAAFNSSAPLFADPRCPYRPWLQR